MDDQTYDGIHRPQPQPWLYEGEAFISIMEEVFGKPYVVVSRNAVSNLPDQISVLKQQEMHSVPEPEPTTTYIPRERSTKGRNALRERAMQKLWGHPAVRVMRGVRGVR